MSERFAFIAAEYDRNLTKGMAGAPTLAQMLSWLEVSRSGFYEWRNHEPTATDIRREQLTQMIRQLFEEFKGTYGYRRIHAELARAGVQVGDELVRRIMREEGLVTVQPKPYKTTTVHDNDGHTTPDLVHRDFTAECPGIKLVGDITYIRTWQGWLFLATVIDCFNKEVIGYAMADHMRDDLVIDAIRMAAANHNLKPDAIMHTDRGSQYGSHHYRAVLKELDLRPSHGRTGVCWDNALAESFFASLKNERVHHMVYPTRKKASEDIARWIELHYNRRRLHSALGYRTPQEVRNDYLNEQHAA